VADKEQAMRVADENFWTEIFALRGSVTPYVARRVLVFGLLALVLCIINWWVHPDLAVDLGLFEVAGAVLGILLVFRTNAGYDRWYEGRKLMGGIVNDTRNLTITALTHGPDDRAWRDTTVRWIASFGHVCRASLRGEGVPPEVRALLGSQCAGQIAQSEHMPSYVALRIGQLLRQACDSMGMERIGFRQADMERAALITDIGACERIRATPIPWAYSVNIRRLIFIYLAAAPFAVLNRVDWLTPLVTMLVAYPILSLDQIGVELQNPFAVKNLNHLPLDEITAKIEKNLLGLLADLESESD